MTVFIRMIVRERVAAGDTDEQVRGFMTERYGDWILMKPPFKTETLLLWLGPLLLVLIGGVGVWLYVRRQIHQSAAPLSAAAQERLDALLSEDQ